MTTPAGGSNGANPDSRLPPHDTEAEEAVVASILVDPDVMPKVAPILEPADFFREQNAWAFEACRDLWQRGESINQITVAHELNRRGRLEEIGGSAYLSRLVAELPTSIGVESYAGLVRESAVRRRLVTQAGALAGAAHSGADVGSVLDAAEAALAELRAGSPAVAAVEIADAAEPEPLEDLIEWLEKVGTLAGLYGNEGTGKSWIGVYRDTCLTAGLPFLGRATRRCDCIFIDFELYAAEFSRKAWAVARALGLDRPPRGLYYLQADRPLLAMIPTIRAAIRRTGAGSITIDSLSMSGVVDADTALAARRELASLGVSCFLIDHQARVQKFESHDTKAPYGTRFKEAMVASLFQLDLADIQPDGGIDVLLRDKKNRHGPHRPDMGLRILFGADRVTFTAIDPSASVGLEEKMAGLDRVEAILQRLGEATPQEIASETTGLSKKSVTTFLSRLKKRGRAIDFPGQTSRDPHLWRPSTSTPSSRDETAAVRVDGLIGPSTHQRGEQQQPPSTRSTRHQGEPSTRADDSCQVCGKPVEFYSPTGARLCGEHAKQREEKVMP